MAGWKDLGFWVGDGLDVWTVEVVRELQRKPRDSIENSLDMVPMDFTIDQSRVDVVLYRLNVFLNRDAASSSRFSVAPSRLTYLNDGLQIRRMNINRIQNP